MAIEIIHDQISNHRHDDGTSDHLQARGNVHLTFTVCHKYDTNSAYADQSLYEDIG